MTYVDPNLSVGMSGDGLPRHATRDINIYCRSIRCKVQLKIEIRRNQHRLCHHSIAQLRRGKGRVSKRY